MKNIPFANIPFTENTAYVVTIERVVSDIRRGLPVVLVAAEGEAMLVAAVEAIGSDELAWLTAVDEGRLSLVLTAKRAHFLLPGTTLEGHVQCQKQGWKLEELQQLGGMLFTDKDTVPSGFVEADPIAAYALDLAKLAELLPSVVMIRLDGAADAYAAKNGLLTVTAKDIALYKERLVYGMKEICRAPLRLEGAGDASIVAFRTMGSNREHYAIIVGEPDMANPLVRVHSSCYTGDLLGSLHCDCGDQFKTALHAMATGEGGIILYLMQEGRGIGLTNKLRTYALQATGMDTVDANETLGFDDDERLFLPAAKMLEALHISCVKLLSNNPRKAKGLEECGIRVSECVPHVMKANQHNESYLETKASRLGHRFPSAASAE